jgi:ATP-dependent RNA helicase RhlE
MSRNSKSFGNITQEMISPEGKYRIVVQDVKHMPILNIYNRCTFALSMAMTFRDLNLNASLLDALDDLGYTTPTTIQQKAFSVIMSGKDVCGIAQTGTGKTFAYLLPCLRLWKYSKDRLPRILILVPTRELVIQVEEAVRKLSKYLTLEVAGVYGGVNKKPQADAVENGIDVVVGTPGRLLDLVYDGSLRLKTIKHLVIDEMDEMLDLGFRTQVNNILDLLPAKRQNLLFSATITDDVETLMHDYFNSPETIEAAPVGTPLDNINQVGYHVPNFYTKVNLLNLLLQQNEDMTKVLVFVSTKSLADDLYDEVSPKFEGRVGVIHSNKAQNQRFNTVNQFQDGTYRFIIATDVVARGIDIAGVSHVINFDTPEQPEDYIHRIGRTGRAERKGNSITFITEREREYQDAIEGLMNYKIPMRALPDDLEISEVLTDDELPKVRMKEVLIKLPKVTEGGGAFHEKLAKNKKVNVKVRHADVMKAKYGKPKKRKPKK